MMTQEDVDARLAGLAADMAAESQASLNRMAADGVAAEVIEAVREWNAAAQADALATARKWFVACLAGEDPGEAAQRLGLKRSPHANDNLASMQPQGRA